MDHDGVRPLAASSFLHLLFAAITSSGMFLMRACVVAPLRNDRERLNSSETRTVDGSICFQRNWTLVRIAWKSLFKSLTFRGLVDFPCFKKPNMYPEVTPTASHETNSRWTQMPIGIPDAETEAKGRKNRFAPLLLPHNSFLL